MNGLIKINAKICGIKYKPLLCRELHTFRLNDLDKAIKQEATFALKINDENQIAVSWWVSAKRTRSYPYARVYDSLAFTGKKVTIIPIFKDEGKQGDRDFLQWDTISLMSLLGVYVIIAYYSDAYPNSRYINKITDQSFDIPYLYDQINKLLSFQSDALHWNLMQIDNIAAIGQKALESYRLISQKLGIKMHSSTGAEKRISELKRGKDLFMELSRYRAEIAQQRESLTLQPKESVVGKKGTITIRNYLGGNYHFTLDEVELHTNGQQKSIHMIEAKHTIRNSLPSSEDIKDGLLKMILLTNLEDVTISDEKFRAIPILKLTTNSQFNFSNLTKSQSELLNTLKEEANTNNFKIFLNGNFIV